MTTANDTRLVSGLAAILTIGLLSLLTGCLRRADPITYYAYDAKTETIRLTPDSPAAELKFSVTSDLDWRASIEFERPSSRHISVTSNSPFKFANRSVEEGESLFLRSSDVNSDEGSVLFSLPEGSKESILLKPRVEVQLSSEDEGVAAPELQTVVDTEVSYSSSISLPGAGEHNATSRQQILIFSDSAVKGEGVSVESTSVGGTAGMVTAVIDGISTDLDGSVIPWPASCLTGPCQATVDLYWSNGYQNLRLVSPDAGVSLASVSQAKSETEATRFELVDFIEGHDEPTTVDLVVSIDDPENPQGRTIELNAWCDCRYDSLTVTDRDSGEVLGTSIRFETQAVARADGILNLRVQVGAKPDGPDPTPDANYPNRLVVIGKIRRFDGQNANLRIVQE